MNYSFSEGKDHVLGLLLLIYDVIPSAEWVFITLGMSIAAQIDINIQGEAISSETTFPFSGDLIPQPLLGMTHKSTVPTLVLNHIAPYLPSWTEHLRHAKQLKFRRSFRVRTIILSLSKFTKTERWPLQTLLFRCLFISAIYMTFL